MSLFDNLLTQGIPSSPEQAEKARLLNFLPGKGGALGGSSSPSQQNGALSMGLPQAFGYDPGPSQQQPRPYMPPMPEAGPYRKTEVEQLTDRAQNGVFDMRSPGSAGESRKEKSLAERVAELVAKVSATTKEAKPNASTTLPPGTGPAGATVPGKSRVLNPMEAPDTGELEADMAGVPKGYFGKLLGVESAGKMGAINNTSGAMGLYQFLPTTLQAMKQKFPDLKVDNNWAKDRAQQDAWMRAYTKMSLDELKPIIGDRAASHGELYTMHYFGQKGGAHVLANKDKKLGELLPKIVFDWNPGLSKDQTAGQFVDSIDKSWGS